MRGCFDLTVNGKCPIVNHRISTGCFNGKRGCFRNAPIEKFHRDNTLTNKKDLNF